MEEVGQSGQQAEAGKHHEQRGCLLRSEAKVGPFLDPSTNNPNSSPEYCCKALKEQYDSVFAQPRPERKVKDFSEHFKVDENADDEKLTDVSFT